MASHCPLVAGDAGTEYKQIFYTDHPWHCTEC